MPAWTVIVAFAAAVLLCGSPSARTLLRLSGPTFACAALSDAQRLARAVRVPNDEPVRKSSFRLSGVHYVDTLALAGSFVWLRRARGLCLWVPRMAGDRGLDDGVF